MSDHTPDFHEVRGAYISWLPAMFTEKRVAEFDRFIAQVKADAWDEGAEWAMDYQTRFTDNPYRAEGEA